MSLKERPAIPAATEAPPLPDSEHTPEDDDLAIAEEAEKEYSIRGTKNTTPYTEYRDRRLGTKS